MDGTVIVTDSQGVPVGASQDFDLDLDYGFGDSVRNSYDLTVYEKQLIPKMGDASYMYIDGTDIGGIVDKVKDAFSNGIPAVTFSGRTWSGMLAGKVLQPDSDGKNVHIKDSADGFVGEIIGRCGLTDLMVSELGTAGDVDVTVPGYSTGWQAIEKMLDLHGLKVLFRESDGTVYLSVEPAMVYDSDSDMIDFTLEKDYRRVNHLIGLGEGRGPTRLRCDWYADEQGKLSQDQKITGVKEIAAVYQDGGGDDDTSEPADPMALTADEKKQLKAYDDRAASERKELTQMVARHKSVLAGYEATLKSYIDQSRKVYGARLVQPRNYRWKSAQRRRNYLASVAQRNQRARNSAAARTARYQRTAMQRVERERVRISQSTKSYHQQEDRKRKQIADELKKRAAALQKMQAKRKKLVQKLSDDTKKQLQSLQGTGSLTVTVHDGADLDVGDVVQGWDRVHRVNVSASVNRKIVQARHGVLTVTYEVGKEALVTGGTYTSETAGNGGTVLAALSPWPVGSIYMCAVNKNPRDLLGVGTWKKQPSLGPYTWLRTA